MGKLSQLLHSKVIRLSLFDFGVTYIIMLLTIFVLEGLNIKIPYVNLIGIFLLIIVLSSFKNIITTAFFLSDFDNDGNVIKVHKRSVFIYILFIILGLICSLLIVYFLINFEYSSKVDLINYPILEFSSLKPIGNIVSIVASFVFITIYVLGKYISITLNYKFVGEDYKNYYFSVLNPLVEIFIIVLNLALILILLNTLNEYTFNVAQIILIFSVIIIYLSIVKGFIYYLTSLYEENALENSEFAEVNNSNKINIVIKMLFLVVVSLQIFFLNLSLTNVDNKFLEYENAQMYYEQLLDESSRNVNEINYVFMSDLIYSIYEKDFDAEVKTIIDEQLTSQTNFETASQMQIIACVDQTLVFEKANGHVVFEYEGDILSTPVFDYKDKENHVKILSSIAGLSSPEQDSYDEHEVVEYIEGTYHIDLKQKSGLKYIDSYDATFVFNPDDYTGKVVYYNIKERDE